VIPGELFDTARNFLDEHGWSYLLVPEQNALQLLFQGDDEQWNCFIRAEEEERRVVVYSVCPFNIPEERRAATMELLTRANYGLILGNFEIDLADGQVRFKTSLSLGSAPLTEALVDRLVIPNLHAMNTYLPAIARMVDGDLTPAEAISRIEG
jgi:hypothetical protein